MSTATGWTPHFVKWGLPYAELMTMMADAPRFIKSEEPGQEPKTQAKSTVGIFQTMLKNNETR